MEATINIKGLTPKQVSTSREIHGSNMVETGEKRLFWHVLKEIVVQPMFIMLLAACLIYFFVGNSSDGIIMLVSIVIVSGISLYQEYRSQDAINALKKLSAPSSKVVRDGEEIKIPTEDIVIDDILLVEEGEIIAADGLLLSTHDFSINESILTGESFPVNKTAEDKDKVFKGTQVMSGSAIIQVTAVGNKTMFGKIGISLKNTNIVKTPLQQQINSFVKIMVWIGAVAFIAVVVYHYLQSGNFVQSFLQGLTLAMSILPEEIPVAFITFQALGAFRLLKNDIIVKQPQYVETLGSATVICVDKTGTLTENRMSIEFVYDAVNKTSVNVNAHTKLLPQLLIEYAMWASETNPFDPMEKSIHALYEQTNGEDKRSQFTQVHEYPISGKPPMMTHIFRNSAGESIIAAKGAPEILLRNSGLSDDAVKEVQLQLQLYAKDGYRVLGVGKGIWGEKSWPVSQEEFDFVFLGLVAFRDPPKANIVSTVQKFNDAGISVKMLTGDYPETSMALAHDIHLGNPVRWITGKDIMLLSTEQLREEVKRTDVFARMFPEAKLRVITALIDNGEVVAMTGDGVNDAPALRAAHIGIAMGKRGSEIAKNTASLILTDDDLSHLPDAVALGRKIYDNLKKAVQYIVSIHIPIILIVLLPLLLGWKFNEMFTPVHVIFLELIMGPTCSIIYENEPMEPGTMLRRPRRLSSTFLSGRQLQISILQGLAITAGCLGAGYFFMSHSHSEGFVRSSIFITLLFCNIFLTLSNRSFQYSIFKTIRYSNNLIPLVIGVTGIFIIVLLYVPFFRNLFLLDPVTLKDLSVLVLIALASTFWIEVFKISKPRFVRNKGRQGPSQGH